MSDLSTEFLSLLTFAGMACATYLTRVLGFVALRNRQLSARAQAVMEAAPGCVLIAVIAPYIVTDSPADVLALGLTALLATRLSMLPTVLLAVAITGVARHLLG